MTNFNDGATNHTQKAATKGLSSGPVRNGLNSDNAYNDTGLNNADRASQAAKKSRS
ncbi:hypothetical protein [Ectobacillus ponti]|uniref:Uncharacterized protein n=1 Tax=Ectobacillus ponti TaxID=2961894 RepID=A0AA42BRE1_9BACI|nr:hypothetical protein [Ectobacillus ponti]MCP8971290.1 hypothetical protein [Ectobacillus ponti]